jgi:hypothetical protein
MILSAYYQRINMPYKKEYAVAACRKNDNLVNLRQNPQKLLGKGPYKNPHNDFIFIE